MSISHTLAAGISQIFHGSRSSTPAANQTCELEGKSITLEQESHSPAHSKLSRGGRFSGLRASLRGLRRRDPAPVTPQKVAAPALSIQQLHAESLKHSVEALANNSAALSSGIDLRQHGFLVSTPLKNQQGPSNPQAGALRALMTALYGIRQCTNDPVIRAQADSLLNAPIAGIALQQWGTLGTPEQALAKHPPSLHQTLLAGWSKQFLKLQPDLKRLHLALSQTPAQSADAAAPRADTPAPRADLTRTVPVLAPHPMVSENAKKLLAAHLAHQAQQAHAKRGV